MYYKLRFGVARKQRVRYLGGDRAFVDRVRDALATLQAALRARQELDRLRRAAARQLRAVKGQLEPLLAESDDRFHGLALRRRRAPVRSPAKGLQSERANQGDAA